MKILNNVTIDLLDDKIITVDNWDIKKESKNKYILKIYLNQLTICQDINIPLSKISKVAHIQVANHYGLPLKPVSDFANTIEPPNLFKELFKCKIIIESEIYSPEEAFIMIQAGHWMQHLDGFIWRNKKNKGEWQTLGMYPYNIKTCELFTLNDVLKLEPEAEWKKINFLNIF